MSRFDRALSDFEDAFTWMHLVAGETLRPDEQAHEKRRERCLEKLEALKEVWNRAPDLLHQLVEQVNLCVESFAKNDLDNGHRASMDIQKMLWEMRHGPPPRKAERSVS